MRWCSHFSAGAGGAGALLLLLLLAARAPGAESVTCSPYELLPCYGAIMGGGKPSPACCAKLRGQRPCLCQYLKNPSLKNYVNSPNARRVAASCGVPYPQC